MGFIPFVLTPVPWCQGSYVLTMVGVISSSTGVDVPWTTPPILSGLIAIGSMGALWQLIEIVASFFIYLPFARIVDNAAFGAEQVEA